MILLAIKLVMETIWIIFTMYLHVIIFKLHQFKQLYQEDSRQHSNNRITSKKKARKTA